MRISSAALLAILFVIAGPAFANAWEFSLNGEYEIRYRYLSRTGPNDLFGNATDAQQNIAGLPPLIDTSIGLAGPNDRFVQLEGYSSKGSDAAYSEQRFWIYPKIKINEAMTLRSQIALQGNLNGNYRRFYPPVSGSFEADYYIGPSENWATNPHYSGWLMMDSRDIAKGVGLGAPIFQALWLQVQMPWCRLVVGRRPAGFGMGWVAHEDDNYATSVSLIVPYGPLTFVFSQYLHDNGEHSDPNDYANIYTYALGQLTSIAGGNNGWPFTIGSSVDQNEVMDWNQAVAVVYRSGSLDVGTMARLMRWSNVHSLSSIDPGLGPIPPSVRGSFRDDALWMQFGSGQVGGLGYLFNAFLGDFHVNSPLIPIYGDLFFLLNTTYLKYNDGRFFANAEYSFQLIDVRRNGGRPISGFPQAWAAELGSIVGPMKVSLAHFYRSGHDRRGGVFAPYRAVGYSAGMGFANDKYDLFITAWGGGQAPIAPYSFLIGLYGTGNNAYNSAGNCTYEDFLAYAGRVDYAFAANLNVFAAALYAQRASNTGIHWAAFDGTYFSTRDYGRFPQDNAGYHLNVPDNDLGWEFDAGLDWKLLEGLTFRFLFARWQPGAWFKWAYVDRSRARLEPNPGRVLDPLIAVQCNMLAEF